ncbi:unnamed protein product [Coffea canephora]|uniref:MO25-like protein At5g47540 n=1 Tax=Coffea canephora TaxID=49390 RepID=A0A068TVM4_COFCA|nr:unnamed protein product [Coffea canephora]
MKGVLFFKSKPKATPADLVRQTRDLLSHVNSAPNTFQSQSQNKRQVNMINTIGKLLEDLKFILYGDSDTQPVASACAQLTEEFFREDTLRLLIICLPKLKLETRKDATLLVSNFLRQKVRSRFIACDYLEQNLNLIDVLVGGYENNDLARHVLESKLMMKKFFDYVQVARFEVAADATETFKQLLTRHKSTVAEFLSKNYDWFFVEYNSKLLQSPNYLTRREAVKLLGEMLMHRSNSDVMLQYVSSRDNLRIFMNLLRDSSKNIQVDALRVFKLFAANENKTPEIVGILVANRNKLLQLLFAELKIDNNGDPQLQADKAQVVKDIFALDVKVKA